MIPKSSTNARIITNGTLVPLSASDITSLDSISADEANPFRLAKGEASEKPVMGWTYKEMGWDDREKI